MLHSSAIRCEQPRFQRLMNQISVLYRGCSYSANVRDEFKSLTTEKYRRRMSESAIGSECLGRDLENREPTVRSLAHRSLPQQKIMRSGPATRTAFTSVNFASAVSALSSQLRVHALQRFCSSGFQQRTMPSHTRCIRIAIVLSGLVPPCETVSEEAATPWFPATFARFGNRSAIY